MHDTSRFKSLGRRLLLHEARQQRRVLAPDLAARSARFSEMQCVRNSISALLKKLPAELADGPEVAVLRQFSVRKDWNLIQLIYHAKDYEGDSKDYEFSRLS